MTKRINLATAGDLPQKYSPLPRLTHLPLLGLCHWPCGFGQTDYFCGRISEVRVYNQALSPARVQAVFSQSHAEVLSRSTTP